MKRKPEEPPKGAPAWMCTFSDLMNLLLCFFVMLFAMSTVDEMKWAQVTASLNNSFSIFKGGYKAVEEGMLINKGVSQLAELNEYYQVMGEMTIESDDQSDKVATDGSPDLENKGDNEGGNQSENPGQTTVPGEDVGKDPEQGENPGQTTVPGEDVGKDPEQGENPGQTVEPGDVSGKDPEQGNDKDKDKQTTGEDEKQGQDKAGPTMDELIASENREQTGKMYDDMLANGEELIDTGYLKLEKDADNRYIEIIINGQFLFDSGKAEVKSEALPYLSKLADILTVDYPDNKIEIIGHTDNVPVSALNKYGSNDVLSSVRAISIKDYLVKEKGMSVSKMMWCGKGEYDPISSNLTPEGRAKNRRVEIRIYNELNSY